MKISRTILTTLIAGACITACSSNQGKPVERQVLKNPEAVMRLDILKAVPQQGTFMFGHHDDPVYCIGWDGVTARSDWKSVCGDYLADM